jgi:hypothetical protein
MVIQTWSLKQSEGTYIFTRAGIHYPVSDMYTSLCVSVYVFMLRAVCGRFFPYLRDMHQFLQKLYEFESSYSMKEYCSFCRSILTYRHLRRVS